MSKVYGLEPTTLSETHIVDYTVTSTNPVEYTINSSEPQVGTWQLKSSYVAALEVNEGNIKNGLEFNGNLICNKNGTQTKLVMGSSKTQNIYLTLSNSEGKGATSTVTKSTASTSPTFADWRAVNSAILSQSGGKYNACGAVETFNTFEPDTIRPVIIPPKDVNITCRALRNFENNNSSITDIIGTPLVSDNRDPFLSAIGNIGALPLGTITVTYTSIDSAGLKAIPVTQSVTVTDIESPYFDSNTTQPIQHTLDGVTDIRNLIHPPLAMDFCDNSLVQASTTTDLTALPLGTTTIVWKVSDMSGNSTYINQNITITAPQGDLTQDGIVDYNDFNLFKNTYMEMFTTIDIDDDGDIDRDDELAMSRMKKEVLDVNKDGAVNEYDLRFIYSKFPSSQTDVDLDSDGYLAYQDNCLLAYNPDQTDLDNDGLGQACDFNGENYQFTSGEEVSYMEVNNGVTTFTVELPLHDANITVTDSTVVTELDSEVVAQFDSLQDITVLQDRIDFTTATSSGTHQFVTTVDENSSSKIRLLQDDTALVTIDTTIPIIVHQDLPNDIYQVTLDTALYTIEITLTPVSLRATLTDATSKKEVYLPISPSSDLKILIGEDPNEGRIEIDLNMPTDGITF